MRELQEALSKYCARNGFSPCPLELVRLTEERLRSKDFSQHGAITRRKWKRGLLGGTKMEASLQSEEAGEVATCENQRNSRQKKDLNSIA